MNERTCYECLIEAFGKLLTQYPATILSEISRPITIYLITKYAHINPLKGRGVNWLQFAFPV